MAFSYSILDRQRHSEMTWVIYLICLSHIYCILKQSLKKQHFYIRVKKVFSMLSFFSDFSLKIKVSLIWFCLKISMKLFVLHLMFTGRIVGQQYQALLPCNIRQ